MAISWAHDRRVLKSVILLLIGAICFTAPSLLNAQLKPSPMKIGVVNFELIYQAYPEFRKMEERLQREAEGWQAEREGWIAQMRKFEDIITDRENQLKAGANTFSDKKKTELQTQIDSLKLEMQIRYNQQATMEQERYAKRKSELLSGVLETVNKQIEAIGEAEGYDLIIDAANGTVVYARDPDDLTDKLLRKLKEK